MNRPNLNKILKEIEEDKEQYLLKCKSSYSDYIAAAQILFSDYYNFHNAFKQLHSLVEESLNYKKMGDLESEIDSLEKAVNLNTDIPYVYERLAIIYSKKKDYKKAQEVCKKWFNSEFWKIPNMSSTSLKLLRRLNKLNIKLEK